MFHLSNLLYFVLAACLVSDSLRIFGVKASLFSKNFVFLMERKKANKGEFFVKSLIVGLCFSTTSLIMDCKYLLGREEELHTMDNADGDAARSTYCKNQIIMILRTSCALLRPRRAFYVIKGFLCRLPMENL